MNKVEISASILSANFANLGQELTDVISAGVDSIHYDVMDMHYVKNLTFGPVVLNSVRSIIQDVPVNVHLMVTKPIDFVQAFVDLQVNSLIIHMQDDFADCCSQIKSMGCQVGVAVNPNDSLIKLEGLLDKVDRILVMTVYPGFAGQGFIDSGLSRIKSISSLIAGSNIVLEVDGGIKTSNCKAIADAGAKSLVVGSGLFISNDYIQQVKNFREEIVV